jgi:hypothetical protein
MSRHRIVKPLAVAGVLGACAFAAPSASGLQDLASPDARDARPVTQQAIVSTDLRSADTSDAAGNPSLRSYGTPTLVEAPSSTAPSSNGFEWGDAGIGAAGMLAVVAIAAGGTLLVMRRRSARAGVSPAAH